MGNFYANILEALKHGEEAVMVTTCTNGETTQMIYTGDATSWRKNKQLRTND